MRWTMIALVMWMGFAGQAHLARGGVVVGRDGKVYRGMVEFKAGNQVAITPAGSDAVLLPFAEVTRLSMVDEPIAPPPAAASDGSSLPPPWRHADVGRVKAAGDAVSNSGGFVLRGGGWGLWGPSDSGHVMYQPLIGDGEIVARVADLPTEENSFQAGLTIRSGPEADAAQVAVMFHHDGIPHLSYRPVNGRAQGARTAEARPNHWLRLIRAHDVFSAFCSADGQNWLPVGSARVTMSERVYAGLACAAAANQEVAQATFDHVSVRAEPMGPTQGLALVDGSVIAGNAKRLNAQTLTWVDPAGAQHSIAAEQVAYLFTQPLPPETQSKALGGKPSIFLADGDVMEVGVKGVIDGKVIAESVTFGPQKLDLARVIMVVMRPVVAVGNFSASTRDGSVYQCSAIRLDDGSAEAQNALLGAIKLRAADIVAITPTAARP